MGNSSVSQNPPFLFPVLRKLPQKAFTAQGQLNLPLTGELFKITKKLVAYIRPSVGDSEVSTMAIFLFHLDHVKLLSSYVTFEVFVSSCRFNQYNRTIVACTPGQKLEIYSFQRKGSVLSRMLLPRQMNSCVPRIACINSTHLALLFPSERAQVVVGFYIINTVTEDYELVTYPNKLKSLSSIECSKDATILIQGKKKGGDCFIVLYSYKMRMWLREFLCSPWASIKKVFPSNTFNGFMVLKESLLRVFLMGYQLGEKGLVNKVFEIELYGYSDVTAVEQISKNFLIARCGVKIADELEMHKVVLINPKYDKYYSTNFSEGGSSCIIDKHLLCVLDGNSLKVTKIPLGIYTLDNMLENENKLVIRKKRDQDKMVSPFCY